MAKKSNNNKNSNKGRRSLLNELAFFAIILLGLAMLLSAIFGFIDHFTGIKWGGSVVSIMNKIALAIAILITVIASYYGARGRSKNAYILWLVCTILVVLGYILGISISFF